MSFSTFNIKSLKEKGWGRRNLPKISALHTSPTDFDAAPEPTASGEEEQPPHTLSHNPSQISTDMKEISDLLTKLTNKIHSLESRVDKYLVCSSIFPALPASGSNWRTALNVPMLQQIIDNGNFQRNVSDLLWLPPSPFAATGRYSS
jgi:hypothetical protein